MLSRMTGELHDAHTRFNSPEQWKKYKKQQGVSSGISVDDVDGKTVVTAVRRDSSAAHAGIEPGMVVLSIDGKPVAERIAEIERNKSPSSSERATRLFSYGRLVRRPAGHRDARWNGARGRLALRGYPRAPGLFVGAGCRHRRSALRDTPTSGSMASSQPLPRNFGRLSKDSKMRRGS